MIDISAKPITLRTARAGGLLRLTPEALERFQAGTLPKGDPIPIAKAAGLLAAKNTASMLPHCHPISIENLTVEFETRADGIYVEVFGKSIGRTGIEMEALTSVSAALLTMYDLFKPLKQDMEITGIRLLEKTGGRSAMKKMIPASLRAAVLVCSDRVSAGAAEDRSGAQLRRILTDYGATIQEDAVEPDDPESIRRRLRAWVEAKIPLIAVTGGTGAGPRDVTTDVVRELLDKELNGVGEAMRVHGVQRVPLAMLSRQIVGIAGESLIVALPGSTAGVRESLEAVLPGLFHVLDMIQGAGHE